MKLFESFRQSQKVKQTVIDKIDEDILNSCDDDRINPDEVIKLMDARRKIKMRNVEPSDILKVVANVSIVGLMVAFEMTHILNQKGSRFIKAL